MDPAPGGLNEAEITALAIASGRDPLSLATELCQRPWAIHDVLSDPRIVASILDTNDLDPVESPFVFFAVMTRAAANDLLARSFVYDWAGPRFRLPVSDVEPLQEFVAAPDRVLFTARLLTSLAGPERHTRPAEANDPWALVARLADVDETERIDLLRRIGDVSLYIAGVHADAIGHGIVTAGTAEMVGSALDLTDDEVRSLCDPASASPGLDALELVAARAYHETRRDHAAPPVVNDIAVRITTARRFLTHLSDQYLSPHAPQLPHAA